MVRVIIIILIFCCFKTSLIFSQSYQIGLLKYSGGGDWYANLETSLPNLIKFCNANIKTNFNRIWNKYD